MRQSLANFVSAEETMRVSAQLEKRRATLSTLLAEWEEAIQAGIARSMSDFQEQLAHLRRRIARIDKKYTRPAPKPPVPQAPIRQSLLPRTGCTAKKWRPRTASTTKPRSSTSGIAATAASASSIWKTFRTICWIPFRMARSAASRPRNGASSIPKPPAWREARARTRF